MTRWRAEASPDARAKAARRPRRRWRQHAGGVAIALLSTIGAAAEPVRPPLDTARLWDEAKGWAQEQGTVPEDCVFELRYSGPGRYYLCYRQVGGSSLLRIAKVVNGVETVFKTVGVPNPIAGTPFTLSCSVNGTALALSLDGVPKATATDAVFATGTVGFAMGGATGGGASHRATTFSANVQ